MAEAGGATGGFHDVDMQESDSGGSDTGILPTSKLNHSFKLKLIVNIMIY